MAVSIRMLDTVFAQGGSLAGRPRNRSRYIMQGRTESAPHIRHGAWFKNLDPGDPQPPNQVSVVTQGSYPSWFDTVLEFNLLPYAEFRAQIANEVERGLMEVTTAAGTPTATSSVTTVPKINLVDGETVVLVSATNVQFTFYFDVSGTFVPGGGYGANDLRVNISGDTTADDVATTLAAVINGTVFTAPAPAADIIVITQTASGGAGNTFVSETVADLGFTAFGFSGGGAATADEIRSGTVT